MKKVTLLLCALLCLSLLTGCIGTPVIWGSDCDHTTGNGGTTAPGGAGDAAVPEGGLKIGLAFKTAIKDSSSATAEAEGEGKYDVTIVAVLVDKYGVIHDCIIDGITTSVKFSHTGTITSDKTVAPATKNELGPAYGMLSPWGSQLAEWDAQAAAFADYVIGKTPAEVAGIATDSGTKPTDADLVSSVTIAVGDFKALVQKAADNATYMGAKVGDSLHMATVSSITGSADAGEKDGATQLDTTTAAISMRRGKITACVIDSVQAKVSFDASGTITANLTSAIQTKNELGPAYGMLSPWGSQLAEWNVQVASFCQYVVGKTPAEVGGISVDSSTKPTDADLVTSVTIAVGDFISLIQKAAE